MTTIEKEIGYFDSFDGSPIYYEIRGKGEPVVFVYGIGCLINHWNHQLSYLSQKYKTIAFDLRGHQKSLKPKDINNLTMEALAEDIKGLLKHLGVERAHFVGHSFGAQVMLETYDKHPELFKSITFINGFAKNPIKGMFGLDFIEPFYHFFRKKYEENPVLWNLLWKTAVDNPMAILLTGVAGGFNLNLTPLKDIEIYIKGIAHMDLDVFLHFFEDMMNYDGTEVLKKIAVPAFVISGDRDMVTPQKFQDEMKELIPNVEFLIVPYGSHCTQLDFPDYVNLKLEKFFEDQK